MRPRHLVIAALGLVSTGCASVLGQMDGLPLRVGLNQALVNDAVQRAAGLGWTLAGSLSVLLAFQCWYKATHGTPWLGLLKDYLGALVVCVVLLASFRTGQGPIRWILDAGLFLGSTFSPGNEGLLVVARIAERHASIISALVKTPADPQLIAFRFIEAWQFALSAPGVALALAANTAGIFLMRLILQVAFVWLVAFYSMIGPLVVPFLLLPQTRAVFLGWLRTFISIALWPWLFALAERLAVAIPYSTWLGTDVYRGDPITGINAIIQGQIMFFALNVTFFFVYFGVPVAAHLLVSGASRAFRGALA